MNFFYQAKNQSGQVVEGNLEAPTEDQAVNILQQKNLVILSLESTKKSIFEGDILAIFNKPNQKDVVMFTRQLATLIDADVPLVEGLNTLTRQIEKESFIKVVSSIVAAIQGGASLSLALSEHEKVFNQFYVSLVRAGEISGKLHETLIYLADYLERSSSLNSKVRGALAYPAFVLFAMVVVGFIMVTTVLPQLLSVIKDAGVTELPFTTKILVVVTDFVNKFIIPILVLLAGAIGGFSYLVKTPRGKMQFDNFKIRVPQFGSIARAFYLARIAETLSTLIKSGVPILEGITITADVVGNIVYKNILLEARTNVQGGGTISEVLEKYEVFPPIVTSMLEIGEKTGRTDFMLDNIFRFFKNESENDINSLSQLIEPVLILLLGVGVAILVSAVLLPIYSLVGAG